MTSQPSELLSQADTDQFEMPNSSNVSDSAPLSIIDRTKKKNRSSPIWDHTPFDRNYIFLNKKGTVIWRCKYCSIEYTESGGTRVITNHLKKVHSIDVQTLGELRTASTQSTIDVAFQRCENIDYKRRRLNNTIATENLDPNVFEYLYVQWITDCGIAFHMASKETFRAYVIFIIDYN
jgi:hypothetical protein